MSKYSISNRDLTVFFMVTFGLTIFMGIIMAFSYFEYPVDSFPLVQMYYPAIGAMTALLLNNERRKELPKNFYAAYLFFAITSILYILMQVFAFRTDPGMHIEHWVCFGSITLFIMYFADEKMKLDGFGLRFRKNEKVSIKCIVLFVILYMFTLFLGALIFGGVKEVIAPFGKPKTLISIFLLPFSFIFSVILFLGEEYGWRFFLQTALQERMGKRKGIILLGLIWGIWHLPLNLFYYSPKTPFCSILNQLIVCIGYSIFFGFVYMKTQNIWTVSIIHFINNNLGFVLYGSTGADVVFSWEAVLGNLICLSIVYMPFLLTKEYKEYV